MAKSPGSTGDYVKTSFLYFAEVLFPGRGRNCFQAAGAIVFKPEAQSHGERRSEEKGPFMDGNWLMAVNFTSLWPFVLIAGTAFAELSPGERMNNRGFASTLLRVSRKGFEKQ